MIYSAIGTPGQPVVRYTTNPGMVVLDQGQVVVLVGDTLPATPMAISTDGKSLVGLTVDPSVAAAASWRGIRQHRNALLDATLWTTDGSSPLTPSQQAAYQSYRAALHRVTVDNSDPSAITWPVAPSYAFPASADRYCAEIDRQVSIACKALITPSAVKAMLYRAKQDEVKAYRSLTSAILGGIDGNTMMMSYPTLMAMVAVYYTGATTSAAQRTALAAMVTKVEAGISTSMTRLRTIDALGVKAKEDIRAANTDTARATIVTNASKAISAV